MAQSVPEMGATSAGAGGTGFAGGLWHRQVDRYPESGRRYLYLGMVVLATVALYYELYVAGSVAPQIEAHFKMSFLFYLYIIAFGNLVGAFSSILASLADRSGRGNLVAYGLGVSAILTLFGLPNAPNEWSFAVIFCVIGFVEGIILVATPALVRDFSPQLGRASAMGFWTLGPVVGSLVVAEVSSHTLSHLQAWQDQFVICGIVSLVIAAIAIVGLKELSPEIRDQLMVSLRDRVLVEAKAKGIDVEESIRHPWRQMLHIDVIGSAFAISVFLLIYYAAAGFFVIFFETIFGFTTSQANGLGNWYWGADAIALIVVGFVSDRLRVRKPFMVVGALGTIAFSIVFLTRATMPHTGYYTFAWILVLLFVFEAIAYAPWMASFTETVERHSPALVATGLAIWGWVLRIVVSLSIFILPLVVSSMSPLVDYGAKVQTIVAKYGPQLSTLTRYGPEVQRIVATYPQQVTTLSAIDPATLAALQANPKDAAAAGKAVGEVVAKLHVSSATAVADLVALGKVPPSDLAYLSEHAAGVQSAKAAVPSADLAYVQAHGAKVQGASKVTPFQWQHWWWVCVGGEVLFLPFILLMAGRWRPKSAKRDAEEHERKVKEEMARLGAG